MSWQGFGHGIFLHHAFYNIWIGEEQIPILLLGTLDPCWIYFSYTQQFMA